jgi:hypothetical protein
MGLHSANPLLIKILETLLSTFGYLLTHNGKIWRLRFLEEEPKDVKKVEMAV